MASEDSEIASEAQKRCQAFLSEPNDPKALNADVRAAVFDVAVQSSGAELFEALLKSHETLKDGAAKIHIYGALGKAPSALRHLKSLKVQIENGVGRRNRPLNRPLNPLLNRLRVDSLPRRS